MYSEIKQALSLYRQQPKNQTYVGRLISQLRMVHPLGSMADALGAAHLHLYLPLISITTLLPRTYLLESSPLYFILSGELQRIAHSNDHDASEHVIGTVERIQFIDLTEQKHKIRASNVECRLLAIERGKKMKKKWESLQAKEKERSGKYKQLLRQVNKDELLSKLKGNLMKVAPFSQLPTYDLCELILAAHLKVVSQLHPTHTRDSSIEHIGFILSGRIKCHHKTHDYEVQSKLDLHQPSAKRRLSLKRIKDDGLPGVTVQLKQHEWIGLEEYLSGKQYRESSGFSSVIDSHILWIPTQVFSDKFALKHNYLARIKLEHLAQTKQQLISKNLSSLQPSLAPQTHNLSQDITLKCSQYQYKARAKSKKTSFSSKAKATLPQLVLHRINYNGEKIELPALSPRVNMFQEEYDSTLIRGQLKRSMQQAQSKKGESSPPSMCPGLKKDSSLSSLDRTTLTNPQTIYKHLYDRISFKYDCNAQEQKPPQLASMLPTSSTLALPSASQMQLHFNASIANNFKVGKHRKGRQRNLSMYGKMNLDIQE